MGLLECCHCLRKTRRLPGRGLCWKCWNNPEIRPLYPLLLGKYSTRLKIICRHCQRKMFAHGRGLCGTCYLNTEIRDLYPRINNRPFTRRN